MKSICAKCAMAAAAAALAGAAQASPVDTVNVNPYQSIYVRTDGLPTAVARRVEEEAQKGLQPLRQYVQRTRFIHQLDLVSLLMTRDQALIAMEQGEKVHLVLVASK
jgi:diacylglycerol kinase family enzyme